MKLVWGHQIGSDGTRTEKNSILSQALYIAVVINLIKLIDIVNFTLKYCTEFSKGWISVISTEIIIKNSTFKAE